VLAFNCTNMELKHRTGADRRGERDAFNCTNMELKQQKIKLFLPGSLFF
jgi:hypothetical protein